MFCCLIHNKTCAFVIGDDIYLLTHTVLEDTYIKKVKESLIKINISSGESSTLYQVEPSKQIIDFTKNEALIVDHRQIKKYDYINKKYIDKNVSDLLTIINPLFIKKDNHLYVYDNNIFKSPCIELKEKIKLTNN